MEENSHFWSRIKELEAKLSANPTSMCFSKLAETYLLVGLVDDALHLARKGVAQHPRYLNGHRILVKASELKGKAHDAISSLEVIAEASPEDADSMKTLARLYMQQNDSGKAIATLETLLDLSPDDSVAAFELSTLKKHDITLSAVDESDTLEEIELLEEIEELEVLEDEEPEQLNTPDLQNNHQDNADPLSTATLAELYVKQGFVDKAITIYKSILVDSPSDQALKARIMELEGNIQQLPSIDSETQIPALPVSGVADNILVTLESWLENARRLQKCR